MMTDILRMLVYYIILYRGNRSTSGYKKTIKICSNIDKIATIKENKENISGDKFNRKSYTNHKKALRADIHPVGRRNSMPDLVYKSRSRVMIHLVLSRIRVPVWRGRH
jgi:hypothetical protein